MAGARELVARRFPSRLTVLFSPQHGLLGEKQDNMIASADFADPVLHLPVVSLYGPRLTPPPEALAAVDVILVDLVDVGTRVYTFAATLAKVMAAAAALGKKVVVLDRPNPISGSAVEGNLLRPEWASLGGALPPAHAPRLQPGGVGPLLQRHPGDQLRPRGDPRGRLAAGRLS